MAEGVKIGGMGWDPGNYGWVDDPVMKATVWRFTNKTFQVGGLGGGRLLHAGMSLDPHDFYKNSGGDDSNWDLMTSAGYEFDASTGVGSWVYRGDPSCAPQTVAADQYTPYVRQKVAGVTYDKASDALQATLQCNAKKKGKSGNGGRKKCCCCCCCKKNGTTPSGQGFVFRGTSVQDQPHWNPHYGGAR